MYAPIKMRLPAKFAQLHFLVISVKHETQYLFGLQINYFFVWGQLKHILLRQSIVPWYNTSEV
jgi:hypothetical protein